MTARALLLAAALSVAAVAPGLRAQAAPLDALITRLASVPAPLGYEGRLADSLLAILPAATLDRAGNVVLVLGKGEPRRLVACPMDEPGWIVGRVRDDGYLTVRRLPGRAPRLFDQQLEGQRVQLLGTAGPVAGVVGVRSVHLTRGRSGSDAPFTFDDAYVDVGAASAEEARRLGIRETTPILLARQPLRYGNGLIASPDVGTRAACAALVRAASASPKGTVVIAFVVEEGLAGRGLLTIGTERGPFAETIVLQGAEVPAAVVADSMRMRRDAARFGRSTRWQLRDRFDGWPVESVSLDDAAVLEARLRSWIGGAP